VLCGAVICFLLVLKTGSTYAGIRHALPAVPFLAMLGGMACFEALASTSVTRKAIVALALAAAAASALPVTRPWEYYNEIIGGASKAYLYFDDEGVDLGQRAKELADYYRKAIQPTGVIPLINYQIPQMERKARGLDWIGRDMNRDETRLNSPAFSGTAITSAKTISRRLWWDEPGLRAANPVARFGNLFVFRGTLELTGTRARYLYFSGMREEYAEKPDLQAAEHLLSESARIDPAAFFVHIELGNIALARGQRDEAVQAYEAALQHAPSDPVMRKSIQDQIRRVSTGVDQAIPLRNPHSE
jgi:tetratricopeptide (TPR) repeat protein